MKRALLLVPILLFPVLLYAASPMTQVFDGTFDEVFNAAMRAAQRTWTLTSTNRDLKMLNFTVPASSRTSAVECTVQFERIGPGQVQVTLRTSRSNRLLAWGDDQEIAAKLFETIRQELKVEARLR